MTSAQHPRDPHGPSEPRARETPTPAARSGDTHVPDRDEPPRYGIRREPSEEPVGARTTPPGARQPRESGDVRAASPQATRRMGRGLSFTAILLGVLVGLGLLAGGSWLGWVVGGLLVLVGLGGYVLVQTRALPAFRDPHEPPRRAWSKLWLIPAVLLVLGLGCFATAFVVPSWLGPVVDPDLLDDYVLAFVVGGMTLVVGAGLGFGLVAVARLTRPDDDDSPLRPTDYAQRVRERDRRENTGGHYDSDWITRDPRD